MADFKSNSSAGIPTASNPSGEARELFKDAGDGVHARLNSSLVLGQFIFKVTGDTLTRPANATPYAVNDSISNDGTAGNVVALSTGNLADIANGVIDLREVLLDTADTGFGTSSASIRMHLFSSNPISSSGVGAGDNAAWSNKKAGWIGSFSGVMRLFSDGSKGLLLPDEGWSRLNVSALDARNWWWQLQALAAFTPSANSTTLTPTFIGGYGRV